MLSILHPVTEETAPVSPTRTMLTLIAVSAAFGGSVVHLGLRLRGIGHSDPFLDVLTTVFYLLWIYACSQPLRAFFRRAQIQSEATRRIGD